MTNSTKTYLLMVALVLSLNAVIFYEILVLNNTALCNEGAFVENISACCFLFTSITLFFKSLSLGLFEKRLTLLFATTSLLFFFREVDVEDHNSTLAIQWIGSDVGRDILFVIAYLYLTISAFILKPTSLKNTILGLLRSEVVHLCILGSTLLLIGDFFETFKMTVVEEMMELNGALILTCAALVRDHKSIWGRKSK